MSFCAGNVYRNYGTDYIDHQLRPLVGRAVTVLSTPFRLPCVLSAKMQLPKVYNHRIVSVVIVYFTNQKTHGSGLK